MNRETISFALNGLEDRFITESLTYVPEVRREKPIRRKVWCILGLAAVIAALLAVSALALRADNRAEGGLVGWFDTLLARQECAALTEAQKAAIDALSYDEPVSDIDGDITVAVEGVTVGRSSAVLLLGVTWAGHEMTADTHFSFEKIDCEPDVPSGGPGSYGYSQSFYYTDEEGDTAYIVLSLDANERIMELTSRAVTLPFELENLQYRDAGSGKVGCIVGHWQLNVVLSASDVLASVELGDLSAGGYACYSRPVSARLPCRMKLRDVSVSGADISYRYDPKYLQSLTVFGKNAGMRFLPVSAVLKNGATISVVGGSTFTDSDGLVLCSYRWEVPFSLDDVAYIRFGRTRVQLAK